MIVLRAFFNKVSMNEAKRWATLLHMGKLDDDSLSKFRCNTLCLFNLTSQVLFPPFATSGKTGVTFSSEAAQYKSISKELLTDPFDIFLWEMYNEHTALEFVLHAFLNKVSGLEVFIDMIAA